MTGDIEALKSKRNASAACITAPVHAELTVTFSATEYDYKSLPIHWHL